MKNKFNRNKDKLPYSRPELLIPVGGINQLIAAVENGADAVYLGGNAFNARINADNFDLTNMEKAVDFCHLRGVKVYVTLNTLMRDNQLGPALNYAKNLYKIGVDALIIQDLGLGQLIRESMPDFELHLSTQGTIFGIGGAKMAKKLGYSRVVLAREMDINEIKQVCENSSIETEVFVHGALCFCFSGQCQLSRSFGGRSGNQGVCAQPCRLPYKLVGRNSKKGEKTPPSDKNSLESQIEFAEKNSFERKYHLSPKDLSLIDHLDELIKIGVNSLKVEGRLKSPEYVATVTRIYRKYIDEFCENGKYVISDDDREDLLQIFNRGNFTDAYFKGRSDDSLMSSDFPKNQGIYIGETKSIKKIKSIYALTISCNTTKQLSKGDVIEARFFDEAGNLKTESTLITYIEYKQSKNNKPRAYARKQNRKVYEEVIVGDFTNPVPVGAKIYRVISKELSEKAQESFKNISIESGKYTRTTGLNLKLYADSKNIYLEGLVEGCEAYPFKIESVIVNKQFKGDDSSRTNLDKIKNNIGKLGGTPFHLAKLDIESDIPMGIKLSEINALRRELVSHLEEKTISASKRILIYDEQDYMRTNYDVIDNHQFNYENNIDSKNHIEVYFYSWEDFCESYKAPKTYNKIAILPLADILLNQILLQQISLQDVNDGMFDAKGTIQVAQDIVHGVQEAIEAKGYDDWIPYISNVSLGREDCILKDNFARAVEIAKMKGIYLGNLEWYEVFYKEGCKLLGDFGINCFNAKTQELMENLGFLNIQPSSETYDDKNGAYPLMTAEHKINADVLIDRKNVEMRIINRQFSDQMILTLNGIKWDKFGSSGRFYYSK